MSKLNIPKMLHLYNFRQIRNFLSFNLKQFGICVNLYTRGQFKITIQASWFTPYVLKNLEKVLLVLTRIMEIFYQRKITKPTVKITQIACMIHHRFKIPPNFKINYERLINCRPVVKNIITFYIEDYKIEHLINWCGLESGMSSYYFKVSRKNSESAICGIKLYNNLKVVIFYYEPEFGLGKVAVAFVKCVLQNIC